MSRLFRRREVWLPTFQGWLLLAALLAVGGVVLGRAALPLLAPVAPAPGARTLVVEGWLEPPELDQAVALLQRGHYTRVFTSGGPIEPLNDVGGWKNFASRAAAYLDAHAAPWRAIPVPAPETVRDRTYLSAVMVRERLRATGGVPAAIDVFSAGPHGRRSAIVYRMAFGPDVEVGVVTATSRTLDGSAWWSTSSGAKLVLGEVIALGWTECCFWPGRESTAGADRP